MAEFDNLKKIFSGRVGMGDAKKADEPLDHLVRQLSVDDHIQKNYPTYSNLVEDTAGADFRNDPPEVPMTTSFFGNEPIENVRQPRVYPKDALLNKVLETTNAYNSTPDDNIYKNANKMLTARSRVQTGASNAMLQDVLSKDPKFQKIQSEYPSDNNWDKFYKKYSNGYSTNDPNSLVNYLENDLILNPTGEKLPKVENQLGDFSSGGHFSSKHKTIEMHPEATDSFPEYMGTLIHEINHSQQENSGNKAIDNTSDFINSNAMANFVAKQNPTSFRSRNAVEENGNYTPPYNTGLFSVSSLEEQQKMIDDAMKANDPSLFQNFFKGHDGTYDNATLRKSMQKLYSELPKQGFVPKPISEQPDLQKAAALEQIIKNLNKKNFKK